MSPFFYNSTQWTIITKAESFAYWLIPEQIDKSPYFPKHSLESTRRKAPKIIGIKVMNVLIPQSTSLLLLREPCTQCFKRIEISVSSESTGVLCTIFTSRHFHRSRKLIPNTTFKRCSQRTSAVHPLSYLKNAVRWKPIIFTGEDTPHYVCRQNNFLSLGRTFLCLTISSCPLVVFSMLKDAYTKGQPQRMPTIRTILQHKWGEHCETHFLR